MAYECYELAARHRAAGIPVVLGGLHATLAPDEAMRYFDAICVGEGERQWPRILADARRGALRRVYRDEPGELYDLSSSPVRASTTTSPATTGSRCRPARLPLDCEFCAASRVYGRYRLKPVEQVMREIDAIRATWSNPFIELADDNTFVNKRWAREFLREMRRREVRWFTETDVSIGDDPQLLDLLAESGCQQVLVGLESLRPASLRASTGATGSAAGSTPTSGSSTRCSRVACRSTAASSSASTPTPRTSSRRWPPSCAGPACWRAVAVLTLFPGTRLTAGCGRGPVLRERFWDRCTLFDVNFRPKRMSVEELEAGMRWLFGELSQRS